MARTQIVRAAPVYRAPAPVIRIQTSRAPRRARARAAPKKRRCSRRRHTGHLTGSHVLGVGLGGAIIGFAEKSFGASIPQIPIVGRKGALTLIAYFASRNGIGGAILRDAAIAGAAICGYELGTSGKVSGDLDGDLDGSVAPNVSGVASQI